VPLFELLILTVELISLPVILFLTMQEKSPDIAAIEFAQAVGLLVRRIRAAASGHELSLTEYAVLARLSKDGPATTAELARAESVRPQSMSTTVSTLEELGLVQRKPHPTDGRQMEIALTPKGVGVRNSAKDAKRTWLAQAITQLSKQERETLFKAGEIIKRLADL
jgi:DNA-binding MarR family transcriptional regulator